LFGRYLKTAFQERRLVALTVGFDIMADSCSILITTAPCLSRAAMAFAPPSSAAVISAAKISMLDLKVA
jgi:hypothetical protein